MKKPSESRKVQAGKSLTVRVENHLGSPTLMINGRPNSGLMLYHCHAEAAAAEIQDFARAGIHLFTTDMASASFLQEDGSYDFSEIDRTMQSILRANPEVLVLPRIMLNPPPWWSKRHPGEMMIHRDPYLNDEVRGEYQSVSFGSQRWLIEIGRVLGRVIRHFEMTWHPHVLGYHLAAGECGEWSYIWRHYTESDFSEAQTRAFSAWLSERYGSNLAAFHDAWGLSSFDDVQIPSDWRAQAGRSDILSLPTDRPLRDYLEFHSSVVADALLHFARVARSELDFLHVRKAIAAFYGYHFTPPGNPSAFTDSGHHALRKVLESNDIDILCAPYSYEKREAGGVYYSQLVSGSVRLHGKLLFSEDDTVTHVAPEHPHRYHCPDAWTSCHVIRRNILGALRDGGTAWYMDWLGQNWYDDKELMRSISETQAFANERLLLDKTSAAEVAVLVSSATASRTRTVSSFTVPWCLEAIAPLMRMGAPVDAFLFEDLPHLVRSGHKHKLFVVLDLVDPDSDDRANISYLETNEAEVLWTHPQNVSPAGHGKRMELPLNPGQLREFARKAGVHIYSEDSHWIAAEQSWVAVHASKSGEMGLTCPDGSAFQEIAEGTMSTDRRTISFLARLGETRLFHLSPSPHST